MSDARIDQAKGDVKEAAGKVTGDRDLEVEGRVQSTVAGIRQGAGGAIDKAKDVASDVGDKAKDVASDVSDKAKDIAGR